ncbi:hypothetical protein BGX20_005458 [Mortierella sp. AD010]|nr:hypothetical protein BGX20_005458 [Mortierella sp. AD010]
MTHALELHEIRSAIGDYLDTKDLLNCACVSKEWYSTFNDAFWHHITLGTPNFSDSPDSPESPLLLNIEQIQLHSNHIQSMVFNKQLPKEYYEDVKLSRLFSLEIDFNISRSYPIPNLLGTLIERHSSSLKRFKFTGWNTIVSAHTMEAIGKCQGLASLWLSDSILYSEGVRTLLVACANIGKVAGGESEGKTGRENFLIDQWAKHVESGAWPHLTCLDVQDEEFHDEGLSCVFRNLQSPLEKLMVRETGFGPMAFEVLITTKRHYCHIRELDISQCKDTTSSMIQKIMTKMPALVYFSANRLFATDILGTSREDQNGDGDGQKWVCKNLRTLKLCIDMGIASDPNTLEYEERQRQVYSRLSELEFLETLEVGNLLSLKETEVQRLDSRPNAGLGQLLSLKRLKGISSKRGHSLDLKDIELMIAKKTEDPER